MYYLPVSISNMSISCIQPVGNKTVQNFLPVIFPFSTLSMCCVLERMDNLNYLFFCCCLIACFYFVVWLVTIWFFAWFCLGGLFAWFLFVYLIGFFCLFVFLVCCLVGLDIFFFFFKKGNWRCLLKN